MPRKPVIDGVFACPAGNQWPDFGVYFVECQEFIKIGRSRNIRNRFQMLQTGCPHRLVVYGVIPCEEEDAVSLEVALHRVLAPANHRSEWFRWDDDQKPVINAIIELHGGDRLPF